MTLSFKTKIDGKPTYFVEKIQKCLRDILNEGLDPQVHYPTDYNFYVKDKCLPKIHTIRKDEKNRWKPGMLIDFFINARQKDMFQFAPRIPVVSIQEIIIKYSQFKINGTPALLPAVWIDDQLVYDYAGVLTGQMLKIANNDGFESVVDFFAYFNEDFTGKIIHWTDFKY